jgi:hypothetical protein
MSLTYTWKLKSLKKTNTNEFEDVIVQTYWECTGTDADGDSGTFNGATPFPAQDVNGDGFIDYKDLTEEIVLGWIQAQVVGGYKEHIDSQIMKQIDSKKNPVVEVSENDLPWAEPTVNPDPATPPATSNTSSNTVSTSNTSTANT